VATYADPHRLFRVVLDDKGTFPMTLWTADRQVYCAPDFSGCAIGYLIECVRGIRGQPSITLCDELYVDILLSLRRAAPTPN
jgi:hypothetical protein